MKKLIVGLLVASAALISSSQVYAQCCSSETATKAQTKTGCCAAKSSQVSASATKDKSCSSTTAKVSKKRSFDVKGATLLVGR